MIILKSKSERVKLREANKIVAEFLNKTKELIKPGFQTMELEALGNKLADKYKAKTAFKGYKGFPFSVCVSLNSQVVHGFPSTAPLVDGDIVSIDFGILKNGYFGDAAITLPVGTVPDTTLDLINTTEECLYQSIEQAFDGNRLGDVSNTIQKCAESHEFNTIKEFVGHAIGKNLHEYPQIPNYGTAGKGVLLKTGMVLSIEPMLSAGSDRLVRKSDGWTVETMDRSLTAHFEHTIEITENGPNILSVI